MKRWLLLTGLAQVIFALTLTPASATFIWLSPTDQIFDIGDTLNYELRANIDGEDEIIGFGFDLSFDGGTTFITGPGGSGSSLTFDSFIPNATYFTYDETLNPDSDTISAFLNNPSTDPAVSGTNILLGTFSFTAFALNPESIFIGADDIGTSTSLEGLVPDATGAVSFLPNTPFATGTPICLPSTIVLLGSGLVGLMLAFTKRDY